MVAPDPFEPRPDNAIANATIPTADELALFYAKPFNHEDTPPVDVSTVDGNYTGTTDMILRWAACKWGIDEDVVRAEAVDESHWNQHDPSDTRTSQSECQAGNWDGWFGGEHDSNCVAGSCCYQTDGILQTKFFDYNLWPTGETSTAFNADFRMAYQRACMNGDILYLVGQNGYPSTDTDTMLWGCMGQWFSGNWLDAGAQNYISDVQSILASKPWLDPNF
jgi:hypothetical protein